MIGIISYLPDDNRLRDVRYKVIGKTLEFLHNIFPNEVINVVDQNWNDTERSKFDYVRFYTETEGIGPSRARNILLKEFYKSGDEWMVLTDDDVILYDYYDAYKFLNLLYYKQIDIQADLIVPLSPQLQPFKQRLLDVDVSHYYIFTPSRLTDIPNFLILRNKQSHLYYNEERDMRVRTEQMLPEDAEFIMNQMLDGKRCVVADFMIKKNLAYADSTLFPEEHDNDFTFHRRLNDNLKSYIYNEYKIPSKDFGKVYNKATAFRVERDTPYVLPENLATVKTKKTTASMKLF